MKAKIIAVVNQKGGAGESTVAMQLAGTLGRRGHRVKEAGSITDQSEKETSNGSKTPEIRIERVTQS